MIQTTTDEPCPPLIIKGIYINEKIESFGTRQAQWHESVDTDVQTRQEQLGELKWSIQNLQIQGNFDRLLHSIEDGRAYSGTDGSYKDGHGTAAFRIQNDHEDKTCGLLHGASQCSLDLLQLEVSKTPSCRFFSLPCKILATVPFILWRHMEALINECMERNSTCQRL
jgi:hypothetical protein